MPKLTNKEKFLAGTPFSGGVSMSSIFKYMPPADRLEGMIKEKFCGSEFRYYSNVYEVRGTYFRAYISFFDKIIYANIRFSSLIFIEREATNA